MSMGPLSVPQTSAETFLTNDIFIVSVLTTVPFTIPLAATHQIMNHTWSFVRKCYFPEAASSDHV